MDSKTKVKTALISVSDKSGLEEFAKALSKNAVTILSSGGTYKFLKEKGIECTALEEVTKMPEMLDGRVKTLHPKIHGGILAKRNKEHLEQLKKNEIDTIDLVVVNLYPFKETVEKGAKLDEVIENIDIGGPTLIRAAAKNHEYVGIVVEPRQYEKVLEDLKANSFSLSEKLKRDLCAEAFAHTALYDAMVAEYLRKEFLEEELPEKISLGFEKYASLRYGENPHQKAAVYKDALVKGKWEGLISAKQLNGKELSYNNYADADATIKIAASFSEPAAVIVKHMNPCGVALGKNISEAFKKAYACDPLSSFGGIIALNRECDKETAEQIVSFFNEVVIAPSFSKDALSVFTQKKNLRVLELPSLGKKINEGRFAYRKIIGGMLLQEKDMKKDEGMWENKSDTKVPKETEEDLRFAWEVARHVKSNAIVLAKDKATIGIGMGLTSRVDAAELAVKKAGERAKGSVMASDAFFPFKDSVMAAAEAGVKAIAEPGGSVNDEEVIETAKKEKLALFFTGTRHFKH